MKLSDWAKLQGVTYRTAWNWWKAGKLPVKVEQMPSGALIVKEPSHIAESVTLYARVSSSDQKNDLERQITRLLLYVTEHGWTVSSAVAEVGSAFNGKRPKLMKLLADPQASVIVVEHRDRLMWFGFEYVEAALRAQGRQVVIVDETEVKDDLVKDMIEVLTSFCARLYGRRSAKNKARKAFEAMEKAD